MPFEHKCSTWNKKHRKGLQLYYSCVLHRTLEYLFRNKWLDMYRRAFFVEFIIYKGNVNLFCILTLLLETTAVNPSVRFMAVAEGCMKGDEQEGEWYSSVSNRQWNMVVVVFYQRFSLTPAANWLYHNQGEVPVHFSETCYTLWVTSS